MKGNKGESKGKGGNLKAGKDNRRENSIIAGIFLIVENACYMTVWLNTNIYLVNRGQRT